MTARRFPKFAGFGLAFSLALATVAGLLAGEGQPGNVSLSGYFLAGFGPDNYKTWDIQGRDSHATTAADSQADIADLLLRLYSHEVSPSKPTAIKLEMSIKSAHATVKTVPGTPLAPSSTQVSGSEILYITGVNDSYTVTGYDWNWNSQDATINLNRSVVVTFTSAATANSSASTQPPHPIIILSDKLEIRQLSDKNQFTFTGNVSITDKETQADPHGEFHTTCNKLLVIATRATSGSAATASEPSALPSSLSVGHVESIVATDNVVSRQGSIEARGGRGELYPADEKVVMSESPEVRVALSGNDTQAANYAILDGGIITWQRELQVMDVVPVAGVSNPPGTVKVSLPSNSPPRPGTTEARINITGESLHMQYSPQLRRFDLEKSVRVEDPRYTIEAQHLDAEFDPPVAVPPTVAEAVGNTPAPSPNTQSLPQDNTAPQLGQLKHLALNGGVTILQTNLNATTSQAEISPADDIILLSGNPHVMDTLSNATIDASSIKLATGGDHATILGESGKPAHVVLPSLPLGKDNETKIETSILSNSVVMDRNEKSSNFTFSGNVEVKASSMDMTSGQLDVFTNNLPQSAETDPEKRLQIVQLVAHDHVVVKEPGYTALAATAEVNPQAGLVQNSTAKATSPGNVQDYRAVLLKGDPDGVAGPKRPEVQVPMEGINLGVADTKTPKTTTLSTAIISSDEQWLFTSPTANTYVFMGNVEIKSDTFTATCGRMQVNCTQVKAPDASSSNNLQTSLVVDNIVAEQNVRIVQGVNGRQVSTGDRAVITPRERKFLLSGNVVVSDDTGRRMQNADILIQGDNPPEALTPEGTPGQPVQRPTIILPDSDLPVPDFKKPSK